MKNIGSDSVSPLCPSASPAMLDSFAFGVVSGTVNNPTLLHLAEPVPVTDELLALSHPVEPTEVFRFAATCAESACQHFDGSNCRLAGRIVELLPATVETLPPCRIRTSCCWWQQEGKTACLRCPQIVTQTQHPSAQLRQAAISFEN